MMPEDFITAPSPHDVVTTMDRLVSAVLARGMRVFARIDHGAAAEAVGLAMPMTQVLIFGNARAGTPLMLAAPSLAIDLPLRVLAWSDGAGATMLGYHDPVAVGRRHGVMPPRIAGLEAMRAALMAVCGEAAGAASPHQPPTGM